jgi:hypothetical protein
MRERTLAPSKLGLELLAGSHSTVRNDLANRLVSIVISATIGDQSVDARRGAAVDGELRQAAGAAA